MAPDRRGWVRAGLVLLAVPDTVVGGWLLFAPHAFYRHFPAGGWHWVAALGAYDEHAFTDFGGALLAIAAVIWFAAWTLERRVIQAALLAVLVEGAAHFAYHLTRLTPFPAGEAAAQQLSLAAGPLLALALLALTREAPRARE